MRRIQSIFLLSTIAAIVALTPSRSNAECANPFGAESELIYNKDYKTMQFCDGLQWQTMKGAGPVFRFTDQTGVATSTLIESDIVQMSGIYDGFSVSISGDGSPAYQICDDATCSTVNHTWSSSAGNIDDGEYLQLRLTSSGSDGTTHRATIVVGYGSYPWDVTTGGGGGGGGSPTGCDNVGDQCDDGSYYIGQVGGNDIYATDAASETTDSWNDGTTNWSTTGVTSTTDGEGNTATLVGLTGNSDYPFDAAAYCDGLTNVHGQSDWYLPAKDELNLLWNGGTPIADVVTHGGYPAGVYWSSTENANFNAWTQRFSDGNQTTPSKENVIAVRCVRK